MGGDGVFHEAVNGMLEARGAAAAAGAHALAAALAALRLAHIPAGSTDAVACTLHGTRGAFAAAVHVCLGDSLPLDVLRVDTAAGATFACCIAGAPPPRRRRCWPGPVQRPAPPLRCAPTTVQPPPLHRLSTACLLTAACLPACLPALPCPALPRLPRPRSLWLPGRCDVGGGAVPLAGTAAVRPAGSRQAAGQVRACRPCAAAERKQDGAAVGAPGSHWLAPVSWRCVARPARRAATAAAASPRPTRHAYPLACLACRACSRAYPARIRYLEGEVGRALSRQQHAAACTAGCALCRTASFMHSQRGQAAAAAGGSPHAPPGLAAAPAASSTSLSGTVPSEPQSPGRPAVAAAAAAAAAAEIVGSPRPPPPAPLHFLQHAAGAAERHGGEGEAWREVEGSFCSIMLVVMPCRSDKTRSGMARHAHLADGRLKLVLVSKCSPLQVSGGRSAGPAGRRGGQRSGMPRTRQRLLPPAPISPGRRQRCTPPTPLTSLPPCPALPLPQYLRFLLAMSRHGCAPGQLPYVQVLDAAAVEVEPAGGGPASCWNLDGEIVGGGDARLAAEVHHGLLRVFARGVE